MTLAEPRPPAPARSVPGEPTGHAPDTSGCPFLASADGTWRSASASRDHRCGAVTPPAQLTSEKQRRLCLTLNHESCATFVAAEAASATLPGRAAGLPRPVARTTPVILDHGRFGATLPPILADRSTGQTVLVAVLVVAFLVIVIAKLSGTDGSGPAGGFDRSPSPSAGASATARATPTSSARATPAATPAATPSASETQETGASPAGPTAVASSAGAPATVAVRTYTVRAGDTLSAIASRFGTTTKVLIALNGLSSPSNLKVGQVLTLP